MEQLKNTQENNGEFLTERHERFGHKVNELLGREERDGIARITEVKDIEYDETRLFRDEKILPEGWRIMRENCPFCFAADTKKKFILYYEYDVSTKNYKVPEGEELPDEVHNRWIESRVLKDKRIVSESTYSPSIKRKGFFLGLLHECGHAHVFENFNEEERAQSFSADRFRKKEKKENLNEEERVLYEKFVWEVEIESWLWALQKLRRLREKGIDLIPEMSFADAIENIEDSLVNYKKEISEKERDKIITAAKFLKKD